MKRKMTQFLLIAGLILFAGASAQAQTAEEIAAAKAAAKTVAMADWQFSTDYYSSTETDDQYRYWLDTTNKLACWCGFNKNFTAPAELTIPEYIYYNDEVYVVVAVGGNSYYGNYEQPQVTKVNLPETVRNIKQNFFDRFTTPHEFDIPATVEQLDANIIGRGNVTFRFHSMPIFAGYLYNSSGRNPIKLIVPKALMKEFVTGENSEYAEQCCVIADDFVYDSTTETSSTVVIDKVDSGELGYLVVGSEVLQGNPDPVIYAQVNKLIVKSGQINDTDWEALRDMKNLIYLDISGLDIEEVALGALCDAWQIERVILPQSVKTIRRGAFYNTGISDFKLPEGLTTLEDGTYYYSWDGRGIFDNCDSLTNIVIPDGVYHLPDRCFRYSENLHSVTLPKELAVMDEECFYQCDLYEVTLPATLTNVGGTSAYAYNKNLTKVTFNEGNQTIASSCFYGCTKLDNIILPSTMKTVDNSAFSECTSLANLKLNEGLENIYGSAFYKTALEEVTLPSSLIFLLDRPFAYCDKLKRINTYALIPPTVRSVVPTSTSYYDDNPTHGVKLYVPQWSFQEYMTTQGWLEYQEQTKIDETILPENIVINKEFEFILNNDVSDYTPNIKMLYNTEEIADGFKDSGGSPTYKYERGNLTIASAAKLAVNNFSMYVSPFAKYYADGSRYYYNNGYKYDAHRTRYNPNSLYVKGAMRAQNQTYTLLCTNDIWQFISFPFDVKVGDIVPEDGLTQWAIRRYDGAARAASDWSAQNNNTWVNMADDEVLEAGKGYIMKCYNNTNDYGQSYYGGEGKPIVFTVTPVIDSPTRQYLFTSDDRELTLAEYTSEFPQNRSWNLVGNPYPCYFDTRYMQYSDMPADYQDGITFMIWNSHDGDYRAFSTVDDDYIMNPGEAIFLQRPAEDGTKLLFRKGGRQTYRNPNDLTVTESRLAAQKAGRSVVNITLTSGEQNDQTRVVISEKATLKYEIGRDAAKMTAMNDEVPQLWSIGGRTNYAINERPEDDGVIELGMRLTTDGSHTLSLGEKSVEGFYLEDRLMGTTTELTAAGYTFQAEAGTLTGRFALRTAGSVTGIANVQTKQDNSNAEVYNLNGQRVNNLQRGIIVKNGKKFFNQ